MKALFHRHRRHLLQFSRYIVSGALAAAIDLGTYELLVRIGIDKFAASPIGNVLGVFSAFFLHKFIVFSERKLSRQQFVRYIVVQAWNAIAQIGVIWLVVDQMGYSKTLGKVLGIGLTVSWNFFLYKFLVYI